MRSHVWLWIGPVPPPPHAPPEATWQVVRTLREAVETAHHDDSVVGAWLHADEAVELERVAHLQVPVVLLFAEMSGDEQSRRADDSALRLGADAGHQGVSPSAESVLQLCTTATERREASRMRARILQVDRLASIGQLAHGVAHEINNPAAFVMANSQLLERDLHQLRTFLQQLQTKMKADAPVALRDDVQRLWDDAGIDVLIEDIPEMVADNLQGMERIAAVVKRLQLFAGAQPIEQQQPLDMNDIVQAALTMVHTQARQLAQVQLDLDADLPPFLGERARLVQALTSVLMNALQAMERVPGRNHNLHIATFTDDDGVGVRVEDSGHGIQEQERRQLFAPFFTTYDGHAGLGLAITQEIVSSCNGHIAIETGHAGHDGTEGAVVTLRFPRADDAVASEGPPNKGVLRLLLVDDEESILHAYRRLLSPHEVVVASSGEEALQKLKENPEFDGVLCDLVMPGLDGVGFFEQLSEQHPDLKERVVFATGGLANPRTQAFVETVQNRVLQKPISLRAFSGLLQEWGFEGGLSRGL